jgi:hypothetical protein
MSFSSSSSPFASTIDLDDPPKKEARFVQEGGDAERRNIRVARMTSADPIDTTGSIVKRCVEAKSGLVAP